MSIPQESIGSARRGQVTSTLNRATTKLLEDTTLRAGLMVTVGTAADQCKAPTTAAEVADSLGVAVYLPSLPIVDEINEYAVTDEISIVEEGEVAVVTEEALSQGDDVYCRFASGTGTELGAFRNDADKQAADVVDAVLGLTETDANVEDGTFVVILEDENGVQYQASYTSSTTTHADAATGIAAAIDALGPFTSTPAAEASDKIDITIVHDTSTEAVFIKSFVSVGASALSTETQGVSGASCAQISNARWSETTSAAGIARLRFNMPL